MGQWCAFLACPKGLSRPSAGLLLSGMVGLAAVLPNYQWRPLMAVKAVSLIPDLAQ
jgi:hypothetical protein